MKPLVKAADTRETSAIRVVRRVSVLAVCVAAYRIHHDGGTGSCAACGEATPCRRRRNAVSMIEAHADDPSRYDGSADRLRLVAGVASASIGMRRG
jgi:hypothetical protein